MREDQILALLLEGKELLNEIEMRGKSRYERHAEEEKYRPHLVLDAEPTPPVCRLLPHVAMSFVPRQP
jgi:hypothetical protein